jgi:hypothetical protein
MTILIMAGGKQSRWTADYPKQLAKIGETTLIERTLSQLEGLGVTVITADDRIIDRVNPRYSSTSIHKYLAGTILSYRPIWRGQVVILLGDVFYTPRAMKMILDYDGPGMFFGWSYEMFAISFNGKDRMAEACRQAKFHARNGGGEGKTCHIYRAYNQQNMNEHHLGDNYTHVGDGTRDFDTVEQYETFLSENLSRA